MSHPTLYSLGFMSGTAMDGVDVALLTSDGKQIDAFLGGASYPYPDTLRQELAALVHHAQQGRAKAEQVAKVTAALSQAHVDAGEDFLHKHHIPKSKLDLVGFPGQTLWHDPQKGLSWQIGDADLLARAFACPIVSQFRQNDIQNGGQGAPFVPIFHAALARDLPRPTGFINIGGVANISSVGEDWDEERHQALLACDVGPGNALIDDWVAKHWHKNYDQDGKYAQQGTVHHDLVAQWLEAEWFHLPPPKSCDRNDFSCQGLSQLTPHDGAATLTAFTVAAIARSERFLSRLPKNWWVCGGGRHNPEIMRGLRQALSSPVLSIDDAPSGKIFPPGDLIEAYAFAYLAIRHHYHLPLSFPGTTGVPFPVTGGIKHISP